MLYLNGYILISVLNFLYLFLTFILYYSNFYLTSNSCLFIFFFNYFHFFYVIGEIFYEKLSWDKFFLGRCGRCGLRRNRDLRIHATYKYCISSFWYVENSWWYSSCHRWFIRFQNILSSVLLTVFWLFVKFENW